MGTVSLRTWDVQGRTPDVIFLLQGILLTFAEARPLLLDRFLLNFHVVHGDVNRVVLKQQHTSCVGTKTVSHGYSRLLTLILFADVPSGAVRRTYNKF